jgi:F-type H+-transporting ATPase subunit epsilon
MSAKTMRLEIVSAEAFVSVMDVQLMTVAGGAGELGIYPGHTALLTTIKPGQINTIDADGKEKIFYISGGMLEVQPDVVTVLADTAQRAEDLDEAAALEAKEIAERKLSEQTAGIEYSRALTELAEAAAQLRTIESIRRQAKR